MLDPQNTLQWQARRIEELEAEVAYLRDQLRAVADNATLLGQRLKLTGQQARVLAAIHDGRPIASLESIILAMDTQSDFESYMVRVRVSQIRAVFRQHGVEHSVSNVFGKGYRLSPEARALVDAILDETKQPQQGRAR